MYRIIKFYAWGIDRATQTPCDQPPASFQTLSPSSIGKITNCISKGSGTVAASSPHKPPPLRTYPPHPRFRATLRNQNGERVDNCPTYRLPCRFLKQSDLSDRNKVNGFTAHPLSTTALNVTARKFSVDEAMKVLKAPSVGEQPLLKVIPTSSNPEISSSSTCPSTSNAITSTTTATMDKSSSSSSSSRTIPIPTTTKHKKILNKATELSPTPTPTSFETPSSHHPDNPETTSNISDEPAGSGSSNPMRDLNRKKIKRRPLVIHDHITVISGEQTMFQCNVCMKKFKTKAHVKYHEFCQNGEKPFKCEQCGQGFIAKSHYEYHLRTHTGERPYVCPKCNKGFNQQGKLTRHMRSHTGEKPFVCDFEECGSKFAHAQALKSHNLIHTGERPFICKLCNKRFTGRSSLKKHTIMHTGKRSHVCTHCSKSFGLKWNLDLHMRTHSSERPYACDQCTRAFSNSKDLTRHMAIHSDERPFKCSMCETGFKRKDNLLRHNKMHKIKSTT